MTIFFVSEPVKVDWFYPSVHNKFANRTCIFISLKIRLFFKHYENVHGEQKEGFIVYNRFVSAHRTRDLLWILGDLDADTEDAE